MPLSEHEQRLLDQMERAISAEDPKFATTLRSPRPALGDKRRVVVGVVSVLAGIGLLLGGVATRVVVLGVAGFLAMLVGLLMILGAFGKPGQPSKSKPKSKPGHPRGRSRQHRGDSITDKMEDRWRRRRETGDF